MTTVQTIAARLAAALIDDLGDLDDSMCLHLAFTVYAAEIPDSDGAYYPETITREAHYDGGEWHWTTATKKTELAIAKFQKR